MTSTLEREDTDVLEPVEAGAAVPAAPTDDVAAEPEGIPWRIVVAVTFPTIAAAVMIGGSYTGAGGRIYSIVAGLMGVGFAVGGRQIRRAWVANGIIVL